MRPSLVLLVSLSLVRAAPALALTAEELVDRNLAARGGVAALRAVRSLSVWGSVRYGSGDGAVDLSWARVARRPLLLRGDVSLQGMSAVGAYDGSAGWRVNPFGGRPDAERVSTDESRVLRLDADLDGPLLGWKEKGFALAHLGTDDVDGTAAHKLRLTGAGGTVVVIWLDPDTFLELRVEVRTLVRGVEEVEQRDLGAYERVGPVLVPFEMETGPRGVPRQVRYTISRAELDLDPEPSLFALPDGGVRPAPLPPPPSTPPTSSVPAPPESPGAAPLDGPLVSGLGARNIGSATMSGRIAAVAAAVEGGKTTLFVGAASGGVWKSSDGGTTFRPVFDRQKVQSIGAIAIDPRNSQNLWVGTGEAWTRNSVSIGDGVYRSTDGGETWTHAGLPGSERVARLVVDPRSSEVVWACVPGKLWSDSPDRGLYRTSDGGKSWTLLLAGPNLSTGCSSVSLDPRDPDRLLAGLWDFRRKGWTFRSGGEGPGAESGSGLWQSSDGGKSWQPAGAGGLPAAPWGRVEVAFAPSDGRVVYAFVESASSGLYRSSDGGRTWEARDRSQWMVWRPFYFARLVVDPLDPDRLFKPDGALIVSQDGGRSFATTGGGSHGDWHDLWIDPTNTQHVIGGDDGGLWISHDGGSRWLKVDALPVSQFYRVATDDGDPYRVYGGLQDNGSWSAPSDATGGIESAAWEFLYGGDGFWVLPDPTDPRSVYAEGQGGYLARHDRRTRSARDIQPKAGRGEKLRFNWNAPLHLSPNRKGTLYLGAQFLFRSRDQGESWERISPDLTSNDPARQRQEESGGVTVDNSAAEMHTTIFTISESPRDGRVIWVGTDDGNLQLTRDGGKHWTNLAAHLPGLPAGSWVSWVEASRFDPAVAYAAFDRHTLGDMDAWVYRTANYGKSWTRIAGPAQGLRGYVHVVREDTVQPSLLFAGTELGLWISVDAGRSWAEFKGGGFPSVAVRDLQIHPREGDLVLATHGRGIWIVDDLSPLRALSAEVRTRAVAFLPSRPAQQRIAGVGGWVQGDGRFMGTPAPGGAAIAWFQKTRRVFGREKLEVLDPQGKVVDVLATGRARGLNRVYWPMREPPPRVPRAAQLAFNSAVGPRVLPGTYRVRLTRGTEVLEAPLEVRLDRRAEYDLVGRRAQHAAAMRVHALFGRMSALVDRLQSLRGGSGARSAALPASDALAARLSALDGAAEGLRKKVVATSEGGAITGEERLREHADLLYGALQSYEGRPPAYQVDRVGVLEGEVGDVERELAALVAREVPALDRELRDRGLEPLPPPPARPGAAEGGGRDPSRAVAAFLGTAGASAAVRR